MSYGAERKASRIGPSYGGQALIEGVMMRGKHRVAVAVRNPKGQIVVYDAALNPAIYRGPISELPFVRGITMLWDALGIGLRALLWSAEVAAGVENPPFDRPIDAGTVAVSLSFSTAMVFLGPAAASSGIGRLLGLRNNALTTALEGLLRLGLVAGYITLIGETEPGRRLFAYHGAEHKTVNAIEAGAPLTAESVKRFSLEHPRCGTAFLLTTLIISTVIQMMMGRQRLPVKLLSRLIILPLVAGIAYEFIRFASANMHDPLVRAIIAPNLMMQRLTTREPDLDMLNVAIAAMERVLAGEETAQAAA